MVLELVFEWCSQNTETWGRGLTEQQVNKILVLHHAAPLPLMRYFSRGLLTKFPDLKCNHFTDGMCAQNMDLVGN